MKKILICALGLTALLLGGCAQEQVQMDYIGAEAAKTAALKAAGLSAGQVTFSGTDMGTRNGLDYYQVGFTADGETYQYDVDALTGIIIDSQVPQASAPIQEERPAANGDPAQSTPVSAPAQTLPAGSQADPAGGAQAGGSQTMLTQEEAKAKALAHAGLTADQVTFVKSGLDWDDGRQTYDLEFYTQDYKEYDYDIDPYTGAILDFDFDAEYYAPPAASKPPAPTGGAQTNPDSGAQAGGSQTMLTQEEAKAKALAQVPGASAGDIWEFETDYDDGRVEYEGKIYYNHLEYEFEIDGYSGAIRSWEVESIYDD